VLLSAAYEGEPPADAVAVPPSGPPVGVQCAHCHRMRRALPVSGICRKCVREMEEERILMAAREKLGADATPEQLALECHIQRITPRTRKILRRIERAA
jgi:bacterioferritin-associated ferredoxin